MPIIGLNIGKRSIKAVELEEKKGKVILTNFGTYTNNKFSSSSDPLEDVSGIASSLNEFFSETVFADFFLLSIFTEASFTKSFSKAISNIHIGATRH